MTVHAIIGSVVRISAKTASLKPLYEVSHDAGLCYRRIDDSRADYPDRGLVVWFDAPRDAQEGSLWRVDVTECVTYHKAAANTDAVMVMQGGSLEPLSEVLDLRHIGDEDEIRSRVTGDGIALRHSPSSSTFLWVGPNRFIGPVHLEYVPAAKRWRLGAAATEEPIPCWEGEEADILTTGVGPVRRLVAASTRPWRRSGLTDWNPDDAKILVRTLKELRRLDPEFAEGVRLTAKSMERLGSLLSSATIPDLAMHEQRLRRVQRLLPRLATELRLGNEILSAFLELPAVRAAFTQHRTTVAAAVRTEITERLAAELESEQKSLERLAIEKAQAIEALEAVQSEMQIQSGQLEGLVTTFERTLAERVAAIAGTPARFLADVVLLRAALGLSVREPAAAQASADVEHFESALLLKEPKQLELMFEVTFQEAGLPPDLWRLLHGIFLSGAIPSLVGGRSVEALCTYARCAAAGWVVRVPISAAVLSVKDLLEQPTIGGTSMRQLKDRLAEVTRRDALAMLILENVNVCPLDTVVLPLVRAQRDGEGPLPANVFVAATLSQGAARLALPPTTWESLALVALRGHGVGGLPTTHPDRRQATLKPSAISPALWHKLRRSVSEGAVDACAVVLGGLPDSVKPDLGVHDQALRLFAAFRDCGYEEDLALEKAIAVAVAPSLADRGSDLMTALAAHGGTWDAVGVVLPIADALMA